MRSLRRIHHDTQTPLTAILGFAELLLLEPLTEEQRIMAAAIERNALQLNELIDELAQAAEQASEQAQPAADSQPSTHDNARSDEAGLWRN